MVAKATLTCIYELFVCNNITINMSNSNLFLKSGFIRAPLQNGVGRYICQLQRVTLKFCKTSGSSRGVRDFLEHNLIDFATHNPNVVVYVKPRRHRTPVMVGEYLNGDRHWISCRNHSREEIQKWLELLRGQNGNSSALRLRKMWHTDHPSIQSPWTPFTHKNPELNIVKYPDNELFKPSHIEQTATEKLMLLFKEQKNKDKSN